MKSKFLVVFSLLLLLSLAVSAQESVDQTITKLKKEIERREIVDRDESTPTEQRVTNRANLEKARAALLNAVQAKIAALEKYLNTLGDSITSEEKEDARSALRKLSADANVAGNWVENNSPSSGSVTVTPTKSATSVSLAVTTSNSAATQTTLKIISPSDKSSTELSQAEVKAQLNAPVANRVVLKVTVKSSGTEVDTKQFAIEQGSGEEEVIVSLAPGDNEITVELANDPKVNASITVTRTAADDRKTAFTRAILGVEQAAAASAKPEQKLFLEFNLSAPLFRKNHSPLKAPVWLWLNPRITSLPKPLPGTVAEFSTASNFVAPFTGGNVNDIVQGFEFLGGVEVKMSPLSGAIPSGFGSETKVRFGVSFVVAAGMSTPFGSQQVAPQVFKVNRTVIDAFPGAKDKEFIAFVSADRNRFFRQYYGGLRLKSYFVKNTNDLNELDNVFPGIIDLTFGQNETVTGGDLHGGIVRIDGIYPLPFIRGKYKGSIYAFGSALMKLSKPKVPLPIILQPPDSPPDITSDKVFIQTVPPRDADHYRLGVGVDLIRLLKP